MAPRLSIIDTDRYLLVITDDDHCYQRAEEFLPDRPGDRDRAEDTLLAEYYQYIHGCRKKLAYTSTTIPTSANARNARRWQTKHRRTA
jgi:hypothetical protein